MGNNGSSIGKAPRLSEECRGLSGPLSHVEHFPQDALIQVMSFMGLNVLRQLGAVSFAWRQASNSERVWQLQLGTNSIPRLTIASPSSEQVLRHLFRQAFDERPYRDKWKIDVGPVPPMPRKLIQAACTADRYEPGKFKYETCQMVLIPGPFTKVGSEEIILSSLRTLGVLFAGRCSGGSANGYDDESWEAVLGQHGDVPVPESYWSLQRRDIVEYRMPWQAQQDNAKAKGFVPVPLIERVCFNFCLRSVEQFLDCDNLARTATLVHVEARTYPSTTWWAASGPSGRLCLSDYFGFSDVGVAVGVPPGSS